MRAPARTRTQHSYSSGQTSHTSRSPLLPPSLAIQLMQVTCMLYTVRCTYLQLGSRIMYDVSPLLNECLQPDIYISLCLSCSKGKAIYVSSFDIQTTRRTRLEMSFLNSCHSYAYDPEHLTLWAQCYDWNRNLKVSNIRLPAILGNHNGVVTLT